MAKTTKESCGPQPFSEDSLPSSDWPLNDLTHYVQQKNQTIQRGEEALATAYWRLGAALTLVRSQITRGQWQLYLQQQGLEKTRSSKAMAIYRTFTHLEDLAGKSVEAAYRKRTRKKKPNRLRLSSKRRVSKQNNRSRQTIADSPSTLLEFFQQLQGEVQNWTHEAAFAEPEKIAELIVSLEQAISCLQELHSSLLPQEAKD